MSGFSDMGGHAQWRGFDQDYRLTGIIDNGSSATLQGLNYAYYPTNNVQTMTNAVASSQTVGSTTTTYGYGSGSDLLATLSVGGVVTQAIGYTADGRIASLNPGIQAPGGQYITSLSYNQNAQLSAVNTGGGALASYTYDGFGQRLTKTVSSSYGEIYQYGQDGALLEETNASGVAQADYIYLNGRPIAVFNGSTLYYLHDDRLGTPQLATDSEQNIQWQASYDSFGQASVSGTITQNLRLPGQYFDVESGWNHNGFRDYAPQLGRYIEPDPLGRLGSGNNLYVYVGNNPISYRDPTGLANENWINPYSDPILYAQANEWNPSGEYSVVAHGMVYESGPLAGQSADLLANLDGSPITPAQLAQFIRKDPNWKHQTIELRACSVGQHGWNSFAQKLANILGVDVIAPTDILAWDSNGNIRVLSGGSMQTFNHVRR
jgi:RHS repeat-associated protein